MAELIVVTGGSYSGKTSLVEELAARGHEVLPESAYEVIDELVKSHGLDEQAAWRRSNQLEFQRRITRRQHERETTARSRASRFVFCDRGALDGMAYCRLAGIDWPEDLSRLVGAARYAHVFVLATLSTFDPRPATGRTHSHEHSIRISSLLEEIYCSAAELVTHLPESSVADRTDAVIRAIGL